MEDLKRLEANIESQFPKEIQNVRQFYFNIIEKKRLFESDLNE